MTQRPELAKQEAVFHLTSGESVGERMSDAEEEAEEEARQD